MGNALVRPFLHKAPAVPSTRTGLSAEGGDSPPTLNVKGTSCTGTDGTPGTRSDASLPWDAAVLQHGDSPGEPAGRAEPPRAAP